MLGLGLEVDDYITPYSTRHKALAFNAALHYTTLDLDLVQGLVVRCPLQPLQPLENNIRVHEWVRFAICDSQQRTFPTGFIFEKHPPTPSAVLLVTWSQERC